ncbi:N-acetylmuramate alpha-1-phosphate uridylyltransferase MurU [Psychrobacter lutiphocae]|uniref:N-acetylmuramate alpha-1-phosphate uridylyltransferase MurU n=1 Tax=Psychrobacter lutiphocae TaxID=540500 RepID=UPI000365B988|nr:nucleotidyltransferase family protein [Psychrobacter lutiphocae]
MSTHSASTPRITQAMILAAGKGTRLRPLTLTTPKPLVAVGGQPLIVWHIKALKTAGVTDITINSSWLADKLIAAIGDGSDYGVRIHWSVEETPLETAGGIAYALRSGKLQPAPFILINGDVWSDYDLTELTQYELADGQQAHLLMTANPEHNPQGDFAIDNGYAVFETQKEGEAPITACKYTFAGISVVAPSLVADVAEDEIAALAPLLKQAMSKRQVSAEVLQADWVDVGTAQRLADINDKLAQQGASNHPGRPAC